MSEMIERCIKAVDWEWARHGPAGAVKAIIRALREPSEDMLDAADEPFHDEWRKQKASSLKTYGKEGYGSSTFSSRIWKAMIDEALK